MTHWRKHNERMDASFMYAEDLGPPGTKLDVRIATAGGGVVKNPGGSKKLTVITFDDRKLKKLGLGATNAKTIALLLGTGEVEEWVGAWITLLVVNITARDPTLDGKTIPMDVIRIAPTQPTQPASSRQQQAPRAVEHPLVARWDSCASLQECAALEAETRSDWETIPKGAARAAVGDAALRAKAKYMPAANGAPSPAEQAAIAAEEAKLNERG